MTPLPAPGDPGYEDARDAGLDALRRGEVAQVVLAGGMATRFGGVVKAVLPAVDGKSFLEAKLEQTAALERALGIDIPVALMTSFATDEAIRAHVAERGARRPARLPPVRLAAAGALGRALPRRATVARRCTRQGTATSSRRCGARGRSTPCASVASGVVTVSNVDNLGARVDPVGRRRAPRWRAGR